MRQGGVVLRGDSGRALMAQIWALWAPSGFGWAGLPMTAALPADGGDGVARTGVGELAASLLQRGGGNFAGLIWAQLGLVCPYCRIRSATASVVEDVPSC
jgi:hypothetical protein